MARKTPCHALQLLGYPIYDDKENPINYDKENPMLYNCWAILFMGNWTFPTYLII